MLPYWIGSISTGVLSYYARGKNKRILAQCTFVLLVLVMSCNNISSDEINMYNNYYRGSQDPSSWLFCIVARLFSGAGISFGWFNFISTAFTLVLIISTLSRYTKEWGLILGIYSAVAACLDATLFRQFVASGFIIYGVRYLLDENKKVCRYILCVIIASCFHLALCSCAIFAIIAYRNKSIIYKWIRTIFPFGIVLFIWMTIMNRRKIPGLELLSKIINNNKLNNYIDMASGEWGWLLLVLLVGTTWLMLALLQTKRNAIRATANNIINIAHEMNMLSLAYIPFCVMYMASFSRLYRPLIWVYLIVCASQMEAVPRGKINVFVIVGWLLYTIIFGVVFNQFIFSYEATIKKVLEGTMFWMAF